VNGAVPVDTLLVNLLATTVPDVFRFPALALPETVNDVNVPTLVKLELITVDFSRTDGFHFGTTFFVLQSDFTLSSSQTTRTILTHTNTSQGGFNCLTFGSKTSWLDNEIFSYSKDGRLGIQSTSLVIPANQKFLIALSRTGDRTGLAKYNRTTYTASPANASGGNAILTNLDNSRFNIGSNNGNEIFYGYIYEMRN
jgi:hypothetical protein